MNLIYATLDKKPIIGIISSISGSILPFIDSITPVLQFFGVVIGVVIGIMTFAEKIRATRTKKNK